MKRKLLYNTALLTSVSLIMRTIGISYQVWLVGRIGSAGIGLFLLVMSVNGLAVTFAISGVRYACTRLISEEMGRHAYGGVGRVMRRCVGYSCFFGFSCAAIMLFGARPIGFLWIGDARTVLPLRLYAAGLPFISLSSVFGGYFTAMGRVYKTAAVNLLEQLLRIGLVSLFLGFAPVGDIEASCAAVVFAGTIAEVFSFLLMVTLYLTDRRRHALPGGYTPKLTSRMLGLALPLAFSAYARTSLSTVEHLLVPRGLKAAGYSDDSALAGYGVIQGMVFPIIYFPAAFLMALSELLVPEMTEAQMSGRGDYISATANALFDKCLIFAVGIAGALYTFAAPLGTAVYHSAEAGGYIRIFAFLAPIIYLDMVTDGMLKGLGQQMHSMIYNIIDSFVSVLLVYALLPRYALTAYIAIICFTECFNFSMSVLRLRKVAELKLRSKSIFTPALSVIGATQSTMLLLRFIGFKVAVSVPSVLVSIALSLSIYAALIAVLNSDPTPGKKL